MTDNDDAVVLAAAARVISRRSAKPGSMTTRILVRVLQKMADKADKAAGSPPAGGGFRVVPVPETGSRWTWEAGKPWAEETVTVTDVRWDGETWQIQTVADGRPGRRLNNTRPEEPYWNDLFRFWEACSPIAPVAESVTPGKETG